MSDLKTAEVVIILNSVKVGSNYLQFVMIGGGSLPTLSEFFGIKITMNWNDMGKHNLPHFHAVYAEYVAVFDFEGNKLEGNMPVNQSKLIAAWAIMHSEELSRNWELAKEKETLEKINPLSV